MLRVLNEYVPEFVNTISTRIEGLREKAAAMPKRPRVYFEEWNDPLITGIRWVAELVEIAGGIDCFPDRSRMPLGKDRILADPLEVVRRAPDIFIASWCGRKFREQQVYARAGWGNIPALVNHELHEIKSPLILQPGRALRSSRTAPSLGLNSWMGNSRSRRRPELTATA